MLDDTVGPALLATLMPGRFQSTVQLNVSLLRPVKPGRFTDRGLIVRRDGVPAFLEAALFKGGETVIATTAATVRMIPVSHAHSQARRAVTACLVAPDGLKSLAAGPGGGGRASSEGRR